MAQIYVCHPTHIAAELFKADAERVMTALMHIQQQTEDATDNGLFAYMISAWTRIMRAMKSAFVPWLEYVIPPLLKATEMKDSLDVVPTVAPRKEGDT